MGDVANDIRSQVRPDVTSSPIKDSTSGSDRNNVSVTRTGTPEVTVNTPNSVTTVNRSPEPSTTNNTPREADNTPQNTQTTSPGETGIPTTAVELDGTVAVALAVFAAIALTGIRVMS
jgi:hypothetical protein